MHCLTAIYDTSIMQLKNKSPLWEDKDALEIGAMELFEPINL